MPQQYFRVSSGLKSLIGRELITDDFIAVFELVKNSFDAHATRVDITFSGLEGDSPTIEIKDNGKGMNKRDILDKWLFVAYSAKREGIEDYRDSIRTKVSYAGAKGIGRFSCDKLGSQLELLARDKKDGRTNRLLIDWNSFEEDAKQEFARVPVDYSTAKLPDLGKKSGTILRISGLREDWDREKLLKLKRSLTKLINPNQANTSRAFAIHLYAKEEAVADSQIASDDSWNVVNGKIENFLFEELKIKSTFIHTRMDEQGEKITSRLEDRGTFIYEIEEDNPFDLKGVDVFLFALNRSAKTTFSRRMGLQPVQFGSVFLFKNGFRVYPFGEEARDPWGIDRRKQQGTSRFLGTRDLLGRVEISGDNPELKELTSRDGGLLKNEGSDQLQEFFIQYALKRLEKYAVDIVKYGNVEIKDVGDFRSKALDLILSLTKARSVISVDYNSRLIDVLKESSSKSLSTLVSQFKEIAEESGNKKLEKDIRLAEKRMKQLSASTLEAEEAADRADRERQKAEEEAERERALAEAAAKKAKTATKAKEKLKSQNLFLQSMVSTDVENVVGLHHHIGIAADTIQNYVKSMSNRIKKGSAVSAEAFLETLEKISLQASQIASCTNFATKANFNLDAAELDADLLEFTREYVMNICQGLYIATNNKPIKFSWSDDSKESFPYSFRPFEMTVILDNLFNNSRKAGASKIDCEAIVEDECLTISVTDNGKGIPASKAEQIFELGYTTTKGSGFGLFHASKIAAGLGAELWLDTDFKGGGARFILEISGYDT